MVRQIDHFIYTTVSEKLIKNVQFGECRDLKLWLQNRIRIDDSTYTDYALLRLAIRENQTRMSTYLINCGFRVNSEINFSFDTPLHEAIKLKNVDIIESLLEKRASLLALNKDNKTPLHLAAEIGDYKIINLLLKNADDLCYDELKRNHQWTPLHIACANNDKETVVKLLKDRKTTTKSNEVIGSTSPLWQGYTPIHVAVTCRHRLILHELLKYDTDLCIQDSNGKTSLHLADEVGLRIIQRMLLESRVMRFDVNPQNANGLTHFHIACKIVGNNRNIIEKFLDSDVVDINATISDRQSEYNGFTPLHICIKHSFKVGASLLLEYGADLTITNSHGKTAFDMAYLGKDVRMIEVFLLDKRMFNDDVQKKSGIHKYLHEICKRGKFDIVRGLLANGLDPNAANFDDDYAGYTPLHFAVKTELKRTVQYLLKNPRVNINALNKYNETPLHLAVRFARADLVQMLLSEGADITEKNDQNRTALEVAILSRNYLMVELLLRAVKAYFCVTYDMEEMWDLYRWALQSEIWEYESTVMSFHLSLKYNAEQGINDPITLLKCISLHLALQRDKYEIINNLLLGGVNVNYVNSFGETPLHTYIAKGDENVSVVIFLLEAGAKINTQAHDGKTILHLALIRKKHDIIRLLVKRGANLCIQDKEGLTALHGISSYRGPFDDVKEEVIKSLRSGATVDLLTARGATPLHYAAMNDCKSYVELLLSFGANPNQASITMDTPLHVACCRSRPEIVKLLLDAGASAELKNQQGYLPLHLVARNEVWRGYVLFKEDIWLFFVMIFHYLLIACEGRINIDTKDIRNKTPLIHALDLDNQECAEALLYCGANIDLHLTRNRCRCGCLNDTMHKYLMKLDILGLRPYLGATELVFGRMSTAVWLLDFKNQCYTELKRMAKYTILDKLSLRDIIYSSPSDMVRYAQYKEVARLVDSDAIYMSYPVFGQLLVARILCGQRIPSKVVNNAKYAVSVISYQFIDKGVPDEVSENVLRYVGVGDMYNLAAAFTET